MTPTRFSHSEIPGSKLVCSSPRLIAACHVLHRLSAPRHPPCTLNNLTKLKPDVHCRAIFRSVRLLSKFKMSSSSLALAFRLRTVLSPGPLGSELRHIEFLSQTNPCFSWIQFSCQRTKGSKRSVFSKFQKRLADDASFRRLGWWS